MSKFFRNNKGIGAMQNEWLKKVFATNCKEKSLAKNKITGILLIWDLRRLIKFLAKFN